MTRPVDALALAAIERLVDAAIEPPHPPSLRRAAGDDAIRSRRGDRIASYTARNDDRRGRPIILGLCGAQGSGKSTIAAALAERWMAAGRSVAILSLDDLYKTAADRGALARSVHPLFATRGPPGTHDIDLGLAIIAALRAGEAAALPRFDKAVDDRRLRAEWAVAPAGTEILILEGWCVGARPEDEAALARPVNALERDEDRDGVWRCAANAALAGDYQRLFAALDLLVLLAAPDVSVVERWRTEQERSLRAEGRGGIDDAAIGRFVQHYERLTRHILASMPEYADLVIRLDADRGVRAITQGQA